MQGAWIEMIDESIGLASDLVSLPVQGAWIEMPIVLHRLPKLGSRSPCRERGLKCFLLYSDQWRMTVAPRAGSVD